jgi:hypothetical protein
MSSEMNSTTLHTLHIQALENNAIPVVVEEPWLAGAFGNGTRFPFVVLEVDQPYDEATNHTLMISC